MTSFKLGWNRKFAWTALIICVVAAALLSSLIVNAVADKEISLLAKLGLIALGIVAVLAGLAATGDAPWQEADLRHWMRPRPIAMTFVAMFGAFALLTGVIAIMAPRGAVESKPKNIERGVYAVKDEVAALAKAVRQDRNQISPVRKRITGFWGLVGSSCTSGFQMELKRDALTIESRGEPPGSKPYFSEATVIATKDNILESRGLSGEGKGIASTFTFTGNAKIAALSWKDQSGDFPPTELEWCGA